MNGLPLSGVRTGTPRVFTSGQVGITGDGVTPPDLDGQITVALDNLRAALAEGGATPDDVIKTTVFLTRAEDVAAMNARYREFFAEPFPARSTIICGLALPALLFEIEAVAT
jgi:enamine deaminase RidA (YjgF/YER057c/UK114 family)